MPHPDQISKLAKWPFLLGDAALLGAAWLIADRSQSPFPPEVTIAVAGCVIVATVAGVIPFLADYARRQEEALDERQRALESLAHTVSSAAEQISIAVRGFQEMAEQAQKNPKPPEAPPSKEPPARRSADAERLEAAADKVARAAADWVRLEAASQKHLSAAQAVLAELNSSVVNRTVALAQPDKSLPEPSLIATAKAPAPSAPTLTAKVETPASAAATATLAPSVAELPVEAPAKNGSLATSSEAILPIREAAPTVAEALAKLPRKRTAKKPPVEAPAPASAPAPAEVQPALEFALPSAEEAPAMTSFAADGATRLLVTAYIGIGNRLFIRGDGPGLSWERGVALQFVSIGKWQWETTEAVSPVNFKLYKNDEIVCTALEGRSLEPGHQQEVTATF